MILPVLPPVSPEPWCLKLKQCEPSITAPDTIRVKAAIYTTNKKLIGYETTERLVPASEPTVKTDLVSTEMR